MNYDYYTIHFIVMILCIKILRVLSLGLYMSQLIAFKMCYFYLMA
jgi:hypothetical protein